MEKKNRSIGKVLFARTGWMTYYAGPQKGDKRPIGGGGYNKNDIGHEQCNFLDVHGHLYGYFQPSMQTTSVNLQRVGAKSGAAYLDKVLVVWIASGRVIGWYDGARLFAKPQDPKGAANRMRNGFKYFCTIPTSQAVLLPTGNRPKIIPQGIKGGMGRTNIRYPRDLNGKLAVEQWMLDVVDWIQNYEGANLLIEPHVEADDRIQDELFKEKAKAKAQGWGGTPAERKAVEELAMKRAQRHFEKKGYRVKVLGKPYDLECKKGRKTLYVEVKGTTTAGEGIFLTKNEVEFARKHIRNVALYVLNSVALERAGSKPMVSGGKPKVYLPWRIKEQKLTPITYILAL